MTTSLSQSTVASSPAVFPAARRQIHTAAPRAKHARTTCRSALASPSADAATVFSTDKRSIILFDGVCNLCNNGVQTAVGNDPQQKFRFAALQSDIGRALQQRCGRQPDDLSSIVLVTPDAFHIKSEAILRIGSGLRQPFPVLAAPLFIIPLPVRDAVYDQIANNRYSFFGKRDVCQLSDNQHADRFLA